MTNRSFRTYSLASLLVFCWSLNAIAAPTAGPQHVKDTYPGLASGALASAKLAVLPAGVLLRSGTVKITRKELDAEIAKYPKPIRDQLKNNAFFVLEQLATNDLLTVEARSWAKQNNRKPEDDRNELIKAYFDALNANVVVTDQELKSFYEDNKDMMGATTFDQVRDQLKAYLLDEKRQEAVDARIKGMGERLPIEISKAWVARQYILAMNNPVDKARKSGKPTLVDFGASGCRPCDMMTPILDSLRKEYAGKVNVMFIHVGKEQVLAARYGIQSIPVQVFFDKQGKEVFRHVGFFPKDQVVAKLRELGIQ
ncbi:MAG TPA: thioredoxin family protein [Armatimonadota bacterium]|nr:thioredoxin family protein [Armatimonadota bacterium]